MSRCLACADCCGMELKIPFSLNLFFGGFSFPSLQATLAKMVKGDVLVIPNGTFYMQGGIRADGLEGITISFDG